MVQLVLAFLICVFLGMHLNKSAVLTMPEMEVPTAEPEINVPDMAEVVAEEPVGERETPQVIERQPT